jgi:hypothetical protein
MFFTANKFVATRYLLLTDGDAAYRIKGLR